MVDRDAVMKALSTVIDPELRVDIVTLGMVDDVTIDAGHVEVTVLLTIAGCPLKDTITRDTEEAIMAIEGVAEVTVHLGTMTPEQRAELRNKLKRSNPFKDSLTRIYAVASGKGGVGKSSVTANLAASMAQQGLKVGVIDADIYGFSIPGMFGITGQPTRVDDMILPRVAHGVKVMSIGMFIGGNQAIVWRGPMLHRALEQFLTDVHWGDLDVLFLDLPPGTGDIAISVAQLLPQSELLVVTTPQHAAAQVAQRAGSIAVQTSQKVAGVIENMSYMTMPDGSTLDVFGSGGGEDVAQNLTDTLDYPVRVLGQVPLDPPVREGGDDGTPAAIAHPESAASKVFSQMAHELSHRSRGLSGRSLGVTPS